MSDPKGLNSIEEMQESSPVKVKSFLLQLIGSGKSIESNKKPLHRGQLFAKEKYFSKKNQ